MGHTPVCTRENRQAPAGQTVSGGGCTSWKIPVLKCRASIGDHTARVQAKRNAAADNITMDSSDHGARYLSKLANALRHHEHAVSNLGEQSFNVLAVRIAADTKVRASRLNQEAAGEGMDFHMPNDLCELAR